MGNFQHCIDRILAEEGGQSNHPADPGGLTKFGISQHAYPTLDMAHLTLADAEALYRRDYWQPIQGDQLPPGLDLLMLDCAINQGVITAIRLLQEAVGVTVDGIIGPVTLAHAHQAMPELLVDYGALRAWRYEINRNEDAFGKGWFRRLFRLFALAQAWSRL